MTCAVACHALAIAAIATGEQQAHGDDERREPEPNRPDDGLPNERRGQRHVLVHPLLKPEQDGKRWNSSDFDLRISFGFRISGFGFRRQVTFATRFSLPGGEQDLVAAEPANAAGISGHQ